MADQRILIEFATDTTELESALAELEKLGKIDKTAADAFRNANKALTDRVKALESLVVSQKKVAQGGKEVQTSLNAAATALSSLPASLTKGGSQEVVQGFLDGVNDALQEISTTSTQAGDSLAGIGNKAQPATEKVVSLKTELRQLKEQIASGTLKGDDLVIATKRAAELQDQIADVNTQVRNLASDTRGIDALVDATNAVAGGFQIVQGAAALFGEENEDLQKTLVRLTAVMSIANGLQQVGNLLQKESSLVLAVSNIQQKALVLGKTLEGAAESKNIVVRTAAIATQKALNAAMAANPAGLLVTAIVALGGALFAFTRTTEDATEAQIALNEAETESIKINNQLAGLRQGRQQQFLNTKQKEIDLLKAQGATEEQIAAKQVELAKQRKTFADAEAGLAGDNLARLQQLEARERELLNRKKALSDQTIKQGKFDKEAREQELKLIDSQIAKNDELLTGVRSRLKEQNDATQDLALAEANLLKTQQDAAKAAADADKQRAERFRELQLQRLEDERAVIEARLLAAKDGTAEELRLKIDLLAKQAQIDTFSLTGTKNTEAQRLLILQKFYDDAEKLRADFDKDGKGTGQAERDKAKAQLVADLAAQNQIQRNDLQIRLNSAKEGSEEELAIKKGILENEAEARRQTARATITDSELLASELNRINSDLNKAKEEADQQYYDAKDRKRKEDLAKEEEAAQQILEFYFQSAEQVSAFLFDQGTQNRQAQLDAELQKIADLRDAELSNKKLTEDQKAKINDKYAKQEAKLKEEAYKKQRDADTSQAIVNGLLGVTKVLATTPTGDFGVARALLIAQTVLTTALQVAAIRNAPIPKFAKGVLNLQGPGNGTSDSITARLSRGESVMTARETADHLPLLSAIRSGKLDKKMSAMFADIALKPLSAKALDGSQVSLSIDYKRLAKAVGGELGSGIEELVQINLAQKKALDSMQGREIIIRTEPRYR